MNTIILATDFSAVAKHAADYAAQLAHNLNFGLHLFHSYPIPITNIENPMPIVNMDELAGISKDNMADEAKRLHSLFPDVAISSSISPGEVLDGLDEMVDTYHPALVVTGTSGEGSNILWDNIAIEALKHLHVPVLSVPINAQWKKIEKICLSVDYKNADDNFPFYDIKKWTRITNANLDVLNVSGSDEKLIPENRFKSMLEELSPQYFSIENKSLGEGVSEFVESHGADWLILVPKKHGFFQTLFHKSRTEMLAKANHVPILALHQRED